MEGVLQRITVVLAMATAFAGAQSASLYTEPFADPGAWSRLAVSDRGAWRLVKVDGRTALELLGNGRYAPKHRSPRSVAVWTEWVFGGFELEVDVLQTGREYAHRDLCIFFGVQSPDHYYYAHLSSRADASAHHVHYVGNAARRPVTVRRSAGVPWGRDRWHRVRVVRDLARKEVSVWFPGIKEPVLVGSTPASERGFVGFGSFDDTGRFANLTVRSSDAARGDVKPFAGWKARPWTARKATTLSDDGGWCWFQDERAVVHRGRVVVGSVATGTRDPARRGDVQAVTWNPDDGSVGRIELHDRLEVDDHDAPVFQPLPDGSLLAVWTRHGRDARIWSARSSAAAPFTFGKATATVPTADSRITYSNVYALSGEGGRVYDFFRGLDGSWKPSYVFSDDGGRSWEKGNVVIRVPGAVKHRPYVRYASDGKESIHLVYTEGHPRNFDNSLYHAVYRGGWLHASDGTRLARLRDGLQRPSSGTRIFRGAPDRVAWPCAAATDAQGRPCVLYTVQMDGAGIPPGRGGEDHRFRRARWNGTAWTDEAVAFAGARLYAGEDDYTGLAAFDPRDPDRVFIATNAHPETGRPLVSASDGRRHHELFAGRRLTSGSWRWTPLTQHSRSDNLRPIALRWKKRVVLLWLRGAYRSFTDYDLAIQGMLVP